MSLAFRWDRKVRLLVLSSHEEDFALEKDGIQVLRNIYLLEIAAMGSGVLKPAYSLNPAFWSTRKELEFEAGVPKGVIIFKNETA